MEIPYIILLAFVLLAIVIALMMMKDDGRHCKNCKYFERSGNNGGTCLFHFKYFFEWETCHRWKEQKNEDTDGD